MASGSDGISLLDVLRQLPQDVIYQNIWSVPVVPRGSLRRICKQTVIMADQLVTELDLHDTHINTDGNADFGDEEAAPLLSLRALKAEIWHQASEQRCSYLGRLPRLHTLSLRHWHGDAALVALITRYGLATRGQVRSLTLHGTPISIAATSAMRSACPGLQQLTLLCADRGSRSGEVVGDLLLPLQGSSLTDVSCLLEAAQGARPRVWTRLDLGRSLRSCPAKQAAVATACRLRHSAGLDLKHTN